MSTPSGGFPPIYLLKRDEGKKSKKEKNATNEPKKREATEDEGKKLVNIQEVLKKRKNIPFISLGQSSLDRK